MQSLSKMISLLVRWLLCALSISLLAAPIGEARGLAYPVESIDSITLFDAQRERSIPVKIYYPDVKAMVPLIVFSHGYGGDKEGYTYLARGWAAAGYVVILPSHEGTDRQALLAAGAASLFRGESVVTPQHVEDNARDVSFIISSLAEIEREAPVLGNLIDGRQVGVAGHSLGAATTLVLDGARVPGRSEFVTDPRPEAFIAISPQGTFSSADADRWRTVERPTMTMYGSHDVSMEHQPPSWREQPFDRMPAGDKYNVVVDGANHFSFADAPSDPSTAAFLSLGQSRDINQIHQYIVASTLVFWNAYLKDDSAAKAQLQSHASLVSGPNLGALTSK